MYRNLSAQDYLSNPDHYCLVDVRSDDEWEAYHRPEATHVSLIELEPSRLPREKPLVILCRTGGRSLRACEMLSAGGIDSFNLQGGLRALVQYQAQQGLISKEQFEEQMAKL